MNPVRKSLVRPILLGGMERVPLVILLFLSGVFILFQTPASVASGLVILGTGIFVLRRTAERDPEFFHVLFRRLKYGRYHGPVPLDSNRQETDFWRL